MIRSILIPIVFLWAEGNHVSISYPDAGVDSLLRAGIDLTIRQEYDSARVVFQMISRGDPRNPAGSLFEAGVLQTQAMDYEELMPKPEFDSLIARSTDLSEEMIERNPDSPWGHFFLGTALGNEALARAQQGDWFGAAMKAFSSASSLEDALERDSMLVDAYAGMGTYYYWKSRRLDFLMWLPFVPDRREEGIRLLEICAAKGLYSRYAALSSLVSIYLDAEAYDRAAERAMEALDRYPENRIFLWGLATAFERSGRTRDAIGAYQRLLAILENDIRPNPYNELVCRLNLLSLHLRHGERDGAPEELRRIRELLAAPHGEHLADRLRDKEERTRGLQAALDSTGQ